MGRVIVFVVTGAFALFSVAYLATTFLYLTPPNPLKAVWQPVVVALVHPLFAQNWHLFAPDPIRSNFVLTARCRTRAGVVSAWEDLTTPYVARLQRQRTSPASRLVRMQQNAMRAVLIGNPGEWRLLACRRDRRSAACLRDSPENERTRRVGLQVLVRAVSRMCDGLLGPGQAAAVQISLLVHQPPPWSGRDRPDVEGITRMVRLPWSPYEPVHRAEAAR